MIFLIRVYQWCLSPFLGRCCRFSPSCSEYAIQALRRHGMMRGSLLALKRISRCHPGNICGDDPVPARKNAKTQRRGDAKKGNSC